MRARHAAPIRRSALIGLALAAAAATAHADQPLWELGLGLGALSLPHYRGSEQSHRWLLPVPYAIYRGKIFKSDDEGTRAVLFDTERADLDISLAGSPPLKSSDNRARRGMPDLAPTLEIGPNLNLRLARAPGWKLDLRLPLRAAFTVERGAQRIGWAASPKLNLDVNLAGWNLGLEAGPLWGDRRQNAYFYDVAPVFASASRPAYRAPGGWGGWQGTVALSRKSGPLWTAMYLRGDSLAGARFASSPLVTARQTWSAGLALAWTLKSSEARVPDRE